jgi:hypothetical protein
MRFRTTSLALVAVATIVAGCGGSSTPTTASTPAAKAKAAITNAVSTKTAASSSAPSFASAGNCSQLYGVGSKFAKAMESVTSGGKLNLSAAVSAYQALANEAPSAIRPDIQQMAQAFSAFAADLAKAGYTSGSVPTASQLAGLESAVQVFKQSKFKAAEANLEAWAKQNCT